MTTMEDFILYLSKCNADTLLSDKTFVLYLDAPTGTFAARMEPLHYEAEKYGLPNDRILAWVKETKERYKADPDGFTCAALADGEGFEGFEGFEEEPLPADNVIFPSEDLPRIARNMAVSIEESLQVSIGMSGPAVLGAASVCAQMNFTANPKRGWIEPVNLYVAIAAGPSERKSPVLSKVMRPIYDYMRQENERRKPLIQAYRTKKDILERRIENTKKEIASAKKAGKVPLKKEDVTLLQQELDDLEKTAIDYVSLVVDDVTMEALARIMEKNGERMALVSSEGGIFNTLSGLYSGGVDNFDLFLKAYSGDYYQADRITRDPVVLIHPSLAVLLMVQPEVMKAVMSNKNFRGRGLVSRFLYSFPESMIGKRRYDTGDIPEEFWDEYRALLEDLLSMPKGPPKVIHFDQEAQEELERFFYELEPRLEDELEPLGDWAGKHHGRVVRIASLLHICEYGSSAADFLLPAETVRQAIRIGEYFIANAKRVYAILGLSDDEATRDAKYILKRLDSTGKTKISKRDLYQLCRDRSGFEKVSGIDPGLNVLVRRGYIKIEKKVAPQNPQNPQKAKSGRPSLMIYVNPIYTLKKKKEAKKNENGSD